MKKKAKRLFTLVLSVVMMLAMSFTAMAAGSNVQIFQKSNYQSNITIRGLAQGDKTNIKVYQMVSYDEAKNEWVISDWAKSQVEVDDSGKVIVKDSEKVKELAKNASEYISKDTTEKEVTISKIDVGAYLIVANGAKAEYGVMIANTYDSTKTYMAAKDVIVVAKTEGYHVDKEADDHFVAKGETVHFTIKTTYPMFKVADSPDNKYWVEDIPTGLNITGVSGVKIGNSVIDSSLYSCSTQGEKYIVDLTNTIGKENQNAGSAVEIEYSAVVTTEKGYSNTANAWRNNEKMGGDEEKGFSGQIRLVKINDKCQKLTGAEFSVNIGETSKPDAYLSFVKKADGVYVLAVKGDENATKTIAAPNGEVTIKGLSEGTYHFTETKAPTGYAINKQGVNVVISDKTENGEVMENVSVQGKMVDTKLGVLPETGGTGTIVFTIVGIAVICFAVALFIFSKKKTKTSK